MTRPEDDGLRYFGEFRFDANSGDVWADGHRTARLQAQPRVVLATLLSRPNTLVGRDELCRLLWPDDTLVDVENGLNIAINKIRIALGDSASAPRFIETVPRRGYRFIGSLHQPAPAAEPPVIQATSPPIPARRASPRAVLMVAALVLAVGGLMWVRPPAGASPPRVASIAVLPFANLLGDPELDYLVEGLADTVNTGLARNGVPRTIARESTNRYKNKPTPIPEIARELRVETLVRGSVVRHGASYAINVQLLDATEQQRWTGSFERATLGDLTLADDVVASLMRELGLAIPTDSKAPARPIALAARKEFETGRHFWNQRTPSALEKSFVHLRRAIDLQPDYAEAWSALADAYAIAGGTPPLAPEPRSRNSLVSGAEAARRAIQIDPSLGHPHAALGRILLQQRRWQESEVEHRQAVMLSPQYSTGRQWYGTLLARLGKCEEALKQTQIGADIDPLTPLVNEAVASVHLMCGQPARAIPILHRVLDMYPDLVTSMYRLGDAYASVGEYPRALEVLERAVPLAKSLAVQTRTRVSLSDTLILSGNTAKGTALARQIQKEAAERADLVVYGASASAAIGDTDAMFAFLEQAKNQGESLEMLLFELRLVRYHRDPRYRALLGETGLLPYLANSPLARAPFPAAVRR